MASIVPDGIIKEVPYGILNNFRTSRSFVVAITDRSYQTRMISSDVQRLNRGVPVYRGDNVYFDLTAPANEVGACLFDVCVVNPSTGVVTVQNTITTLAVIDQHLKTTIHSINATTGAVMNTTEYAGVPYLP